MEKHVLLKKLAEVDNQKSEYGCKQSDFEELKQLGKGSYGTVLMVKAKKGAYKGQNFVMKKIPIVQMKTRHQLQSIREVVIMRNLSHPHIVKFLTSFVDKDNLCIVMEYCQNGDLYQLIKNQRVKKMYLSEKDLWDYATQIFSALEYLHTQMIIHRDIKCLNIFLADDKQIKIGDMGVSKMCQKGDGPMQGTRVGTPLYLSPEVVQSQPYDYKTDIWAAGCALYHMASLDPPFQSDNLVTLGNMIVMKKPKPIPAAYSQRLRSFIDKCMSKKVQERPTAYQILSMLPNYSTPALPRSLSKQSTRVSTQEINQKQTQATKSRPVSAKRLNLDMARQESKSPKKSPDLTKQPSAQRLRPESAKRINRPISGKQDYDNIDRNLLRKVDQKHRRFQSASTKPFQSNLRRNNSLPGGAKPNESQQNLNIRASSTNLRDSNDKIITLNPERVKQMQEQLRNVGIPEQYIQSKYKPQPQPSVDSNEYVNQKQVLNSQLNFAKQRPKSSTLNRPVTKPLVVDHNKLSDSVQRIANQPINIQNIGHQQMLRPQKQFSAVERKSKNKESVLSIPQIIQSSLSKQRQSPTGAYSESINKFDKKIAWKRSASIDLQPEKKNCSGPLNKDLEKIFEANGFSAKLKTNTRVNIKRSTSSLYHPSEQTELESISNNKHVRQTSALDAYTKQSLHKNSSVRDIKDTQISIGEEKVNDKTFSDKKSSQKSFARKRSSIGRHDLAPDDPYNTQKISVEDLRVSNVEVKKPIQVKRIHFIEGNENSQSVLKNNPLKDSINSQGILKSIMKTNSHHSLEHYKEQNIEPPKAFQRYQDKHTSFSKRNRVIGSLPGPTTIVKRYITPIPSQRVSKNPIGISQLKQNLGRKDEPMIVQSQEPAQLSKPIRDEIQKIDEMQTNLKQKTFDQQTLSQVTKSNYSFLRPQTAVSPKATKLVPSHKNIGDLLNSRNQNNKIARTQQSWTNSVRKLRETDSIPQNKFESIDRTEQDKNCSETHLILTKQLQKVNNNRNQKYASEQRSNSRRISVSALNSQMIGARKPIVNRNIAKAQQFSAPITTPQSAAAKPIMKSIHGMTNTLTQQSTGCTGNMSALQNLKKLTVQPQFRIQRQVTSVRKLTINDLIAVSK